MFRIGEFSRLARVSCRSLRFYDQLGLLCPQTVDEKSGYRYYGASQLAELNRILVLKDLGLSLEQIAHLLSQNLASAELRGMLLMKRAAAEQELALQQSRLELIDDRIAQLDAGEPADDDVILRAEPGFAFLSVRQQVSSFDAARRHIAELLAVVPSHVATKQLGRLVAIVHSPEYEPDDIDVELGFVLRDGRDYRVPLKGGRTASVRAVEPVRTMAVCVRVGPPERAHANTASIARHIQAHHLSIAGPNRESFIQRPRPDHPADVVVEMQFPCAPRDD